MENQGYIACTELVWAPSGLLLSSQDDSVGRRGLVKAQEELLGFKSRERLAKLELIPLSV